MTRERFIAYGSRAAKDPASSSEDESKDKKEAEPQKNILTRSLDFLAGLTVPHTWFTHFYLLSVCLSLFWAAQFIFEGRVLGYVLSHTPLERGGMTPRQIVLMWVLMAAQGSRRLYETAMWQKSTQSRMPVGHYVLGIVYYIAMSMAIWVEGIRTQSEIRLASSCSMVADTKCLAQLLSEILDLRWTCSSPPLPPYVHCCACRYSCSLPVCNTIATNTWHLFGSIRCLCTRSFSD